MTKDIMIYLERALGLVQAANCPQCGDKSGIYYDDYGEACQCQWCHEAETLCSEIWGSLT